MNIDSRPRRSIFYLELIEKKKAEKLAKKQNENTNIVEIKKNIISLTPSLRKENKLIKDRIKKRNSSINAMNDFLSRRKSNNFKLSKENQNIDFASTIKPKSQTFYNPSLEKTNLTKFQSKNSYIDSPENLKGDIPSININNNFNNNKSKTFTNGFKKTKELNPNFIPQIYKITNNKIQDNYKKVLVNSSNLKNQLNHLYTSEQDTYGMRNDLIRNHENMKNQQNYDYLKEQKARKPKNNVKGVYNIDSGEMIYIDENKANIINHIDSILKMRNENFYKFRGVCVQKYNQFARQNDIFEYVFGNARYIPQKNYKKIDINTHKLKKLVTNMKNTRMNIKRFFELKSKED